jgi:hypothetical protein
VKSRTLTIHKLVQKEIRSEFVNTNLFVYDPQYLLLRWDETVFGTAAANGPIVRPNLIREGIWSSGEIMTGEDRRTQRNFCPSSTLSTTNPTESALAANPDLRHEMPAPNRLR